MRNRFPTRLDVDDFCTVNRRTLLRGLGAAALLTATGALFPRWGLSEPHLRRLSLLARRRCG
jgi:hypothetical protein